MQPTPETIAAIESQLDRLGLLCTDSHPCQIGVEPIVFRTNDVVLLVDDWVSGYYSVSALLPLLEACQDVDSFWSAIAKAELTKNEVDQIT